MLKPKSVDLYLVYGCPSCGAEHTATREETIFPGGVLCGCGERIRFEPIDTIVVKPHYTDKTKLKATTKVVKEPEKTKSHDDAIALLVDLGYNKMVAVKRVSELSHLEDEEIVSILLKEKT